MNCMLSGYMDSGYIVVLSMISCVYCPKSTAYIVVLSMISCVYCPKSTALRVWNDVLPSKI